MAQGKTANWHKRHVCFVPSALSTHFDGDCEPGSTIRRLMSLELGLWSAACPRWGVRSRRGQRVKKRSSVMDTERLFTLRATKSPTCLITRHVCFRSVLECTALHFTSPAERLRTLEGRGAGCVNRSHRLLLTYLDQQTSSNEMPLRVSVFVRVALVPSQAFTSCI